MPPRAAPSSRAAPAAPPNRSRPARISAFNALLPVLLVVGFNIVRNFDFFKFMVTAPDLPAFYVAGPADHHSRARTDSPSSIPRSEIVHGAERCYNVNASAPDPYRRSPPGLDAALQLTHFCEDAEMLHGAEHLDGWALLNCDPGRGEWNTVMGPLKRPTPRGALWMYPWKAAVEAAMALASPGDASLAQAAFEAVEPQVLPLDGFPEALEFHPLGSTVYVSPSTGDTWLYVVNHAAERTLIEVFRLHRTGQGLEAKWRARWQRSVAHPLGTHSANALVALTERELVVTNDHLFTLRRQPSAPLLRVARYRFGETLAPVAAHVMRGFVGTKVLPRLETLLGLPLGWLAYVRFDLPEGSGSAPSPPPSSAAEEGVEANVLIDGVPFANGVALSPDGRTLAVAATTGLKVSLYRLRRAEDGTVRGLLNFTTLDVDDVAEAAAGEGDDAIGGGGGSAPLRLLGTVGVPSTPDNLAFSHEAGPRTGGGGAFGGAKLLVGGHAAALKTIAMARSPRDARRAAPSWVVSVESLGGDGGEAEGEGEGGEEDGDAPLPASQRTVYAAKAEGAGAGRLRVRTLFQSLGRPVAVPVSDGGGAARGDDAAAATAGRRHVGLPTSTSGSLDARVAGGTLLVPGLYAAPGVLVCTGVVSDEGSR